MTDDEIRNDETTKGEDGREMLKFPSMEEKDASSVERSHEGAEPPKKDETDSFSSTTLLFR